MSIWTLYLDIAGTIDRNTSMSDSVTVSCVAIPTDQEQDTTNQIGFSIPKWRDTTTENVEKIIGILLEKSIYASAVQFKKSEPKWSGFWEDGEKHQKKLINLAESGYGDSKQNRGLRFMRPANILKFSLFCIGSADLLACCIKHEKLSPILDSDGHQILNLKVVCDSDISGIQNQEIFKHIWEVWSHATEMRNRLRISPHVSNILFQTEQAEPNLLMPDYVAGIFHSLNSLHVQLPTGVQETKIQSVVESLKRTGNFSFESVNFDIDFPQLAQEL